MYNTARINEDAISEGEYNEAAETVRALEAFRDHIKTAIVLTGATTRLKKDVINGLSDDWLASFEYASEEIIAKSQRIINEYDDGEGYSDDEHSTMHKGAGGSL